MLGIAHTLMVQGKHDKAFLKNTPPATRSLKSIWQARAINAEERGLGGGNFWRTGSADNKLAELMAANRTMLMAGWGIHASNMVNRNTGCW